MSQLIEYEGKVNEFPDDFTKEDIAKALKGQAQPKSSALGSFFRSAGGAVGPTAVGIGGSLGAAGLLELAGAPETGGLSLIPLGVGLGAAYLGGRAQQKAIHKLAPGLEAQQQADISQHPIASIIGHIAGAAQFFEIAPGQVFTKPMRSLGAGAIGAGVGAAQESLEPGPHTAKDILKQGGLGAAQMMIFGKPRPYIPESLIPPSVRQTLPRATAEAAKSMRLKGALQDASRLRTHEGQVQKGGQVGQGREEKGGANLEQPAPGQPGRTPGISQESQGTLLTDDLTPEHKEMLERAAIDAGEPTPDIVPERKAVDQTEYPFPDDLKGDFWDSIDRIQEKLSNLRRLKGKWDDFVSEKPSANPVYGNLDARDIALVDKAIDVLGRRSLELQEPFAPSQAGQIAGFNRQSGKVEIYPKAFNETLATVPEAQRPEWIRSLIEHEKIHGMVSDEDAESFANDMTGLERAIFSRIYLGKTPTGETAAGIRLTPTQFGHDAIRYMLQQAGRGASEFSQTTGRERWTIKMLDGLLKVIRKIRETLGTKASQRQREILDTYESNAELAKSQMKPGEQPGAFKRKTDKETRELGLALPRPGEVRGEVETPRPELKPEELDLEKTKTPAIKEIGPELQSDREALNKALTEGAGVHGATDENTKRITVLQDKRTGRVVAVSTFQRGARPGIPERAWVQNPNTDYGNVPLDSTLNQYVPIFSLLRKEGVRKFRKAWADRATFEKDFLTPAKEAARAAVGVPQSPQERLSGPEGHQIVVGGTEPFVEPKYPEEPLSMTREDASAILSHIQTETGGLTSPQDVVESIRAVSEGVKAGVKGAADARNAYMNLIRILAQEHPDWTADQIMEHLAHGIYNARAGQQAIPGVEGSRGLLSEGNQPGPGAFQRAKDAKDAYWHWIKATALRRATKEQIPVIADRVSNSARLSAAKAHTDIVHASGEKLGTEGKRGMRREAEQYRRGSWIGSVAMDPSGNLFDVAKLDDYQAKLDEAERHADRWKNDLNPAKRLMSYNWKKAIHQYRDALQFARDHWTDTRFRRTAMEVRKQLDKELDEERQAGMQVREVANYYPGIYEGSFFDGNFWHWGPRQIMGQQFREPKKFKDPFEAIAAGPYWLASTDAAALVQHRILRGQYALWQGATLEQLKALTDPATGKAVFQEPVARRETRMLPDSQGNMVEVPNVPVFKGGRTELATAPKGYKLVEAFGGRKLWVLEDYAPLVKAIYAGDAIENNPVWRPIKRATEFLKHGVLLMWDTFHPGRLAQYSAAVTGFKGRTMRGGYSALHYRPDQLKDAVAQGYISQADADWANQTITFKDRLGQTETKTRSQIAWDGIAQGFNAARTTDSLYKDAVESIPFLGGIYHRTLMPYNNWLFDRYVPGLMTEAFVRNVEKYVQKNPGMDYQRIVRDVAKDTNIMFGSLGRQGVFKNPTWRSAAQTLFLAPSWQEALIQKELRAASRFSGISSLSGRQGAGRLGMLGEGVGKGLVGYLALAQIINLVTRGKLTFQNDEDGHKLDAWIPNASGEGGFWLSPLSTFAEVTHDFMRLLETKKRGWDAVMQIGENRLGPMGRALYILGTGKSLEGEQYATTGGVLGGALGQLAPAPISIAPAAQFAGHALAPSLVSPTKPGVVGRQVIAAGLGLKMEHSTTALNQMLSKARKFADENDIRKDTGWEEVQTDEPSYTKLRTALRNDDQRGARKQYDALAEHHTPAEIDHAMQTWARRPFTGSQQGERLFLYSLSDADRELYSDAYMSRLELLQAFREFELQR